MNKKPEVAPTDFAKEAVTEALDKAMHAIRFNLQDAFGGLLYSLELEAEKVGGVGDIDKLINIVTRTSRYGGPEGEEYPVYNEDAARPIMERWESLLQAHGIEQSWNIGRGKTVKKSIRKEVGEAAWESWPVAARMAIERLESE